LTRQDFSHQNKVNKTENKYTTTTRKKKNERHKTKKRISSLRDLFADWSFVFCFSF